MQQENATARVRLIDRLRRINQAAIGAALALVALVVIASSLVSSMRALVAEHESAASVLSENMVAVLAFDDRAAAMEMLRALRHLPSVRFSAIYDKAGRRFSYLADDVSSVPEALNPLASSVSLRPSSIQIVRTVVHGNETVGAILLEVGMVSVFQALLSQGMVILLGTAMALYFAQYLLRRLSVSVLQPIDGLTRLMDDVADSSDFRLRAKSCDIDELAHLGNGFNAMLEQINLRDEALAAHRQQLEKEVVARTTEYLEARDSAEAASRAKSDFLSNMSHEIRTLMNAILGMANVMLREGVTDAQAAHLDMINTAGEHLLSLISNILDLSKIEAGKIELECKPLELGKLIDNVATILGVRARDKGLALVAETEGCEICKTRLLGIPPGYSSVSSIT